MDICIISNPLTCLPTSRSMHVINTEQAASPSSDEGISEDDHSVSRAEDVFIAPNYLKLYRSKHLREELQNFVSGDDSDSEGDAIINPSQDIIPTTMFHSILEKALANRRRALSRERFVKWSQENKSWVQLAVRFGLRQTVMHSILENISSPYKAWAYVQKNLVKYSDLDTTKYLACRKHEIISSISIPGDSRPSALSQIDVGSIICEACEKDVLTPDLCFFEYIPTLSRLRKWVMNPVSAGQL